MSRMRFTAPATGAALLSSLLLLPVLGLAMPAGTPRLSASTRVALSRAADGSTLAPWQRQFMRGLAGSPSAPANAVRSAGTDGAWSELPPPVVQEAPAVYDPVRQSMLVVGGRIPGDTQTNETWELNLAVVPPAWTRLETAGPAPSPRGGHALLFDSRRERVLLFGGADSITRNDCWVLDLTTDPPQWAQSLPTGTPPARRSYASAVYDSLNDRVVIFGGADSVGNEGPVSVVAGLWVLPLTGPLAWTELTPAGTPPSPRAGGAAIYDRARQRMVLFGGFAGTPLADGFTLSLGGSPAWAPLGASGGPPSGRAIPGLIYDAPHDRMVMFGGFDGAGSLDDVWALDLASAAWTELSPTGVAPSARQFPATAYDTPRNRMVMFSGNTNDGAVPDPLWALSLEGPAAWTDLGGRRAPQRWDAATTFDPTRHVMWVQGGRGWGGSGSMVRSDLWALSLSPSAGWSQPLTTGTPLGKRFGHSAVYDEQRDRLVFFGGGDSTSLLNDVWVLTQLAGTPAWSQLSPTGTPPEGRFYHSAVYDPVNDRMVVFGGSNGSGTLNDAWALSFGGGPAWTQLSPSGAPPLPRWGQSAALDRDRNRLVVFGGEWLGLRNDVHALTLTGSPAWTELSVTGTPPAPRQMASLVSLGSQMLVFGGQTVLADMSTSNESWLLSLEPTLSWRQLDVGPSLPGARMGSCVAFDPTALQFAIFGGTGMNFEGGDTWILQLDQAVPALGSLVSANAAPGRVELAWQVSSSSPSVTVYRNRGHGAWAAVGQVSPDGTDRVAYVDLDVVAGERYGYRLGLNEPGGEVFVGEVWVDVPGGARFALRGMTPNPAPAGAGLIGFSLPDATPARLELVDVSGRRVFSREVGGLGRGEHVVRLSGAQSLAPGLYLVRLTRDGQSLRSKVVSIR